MLLDRTSLASEEQPVHVGILFLKQIKHVGIVVFMERKKIIMWCQNYVQFFVKSQKFTKHTQNSTVVDPIVLQMTFRCVFYETVAKGPCNPKNGRLEDKDASRSNYL